MKSILFTLLVINALQKIDTDINIYIYIYIYIHSSFVLNIGYGLGSLAPSLETAFHNCNSYALTMK